VILPGVRGEGHDVSGSIADISAAFAGTSLRAPADCDGCASST
jgi:hypothetical protein